MNCVHTKRHTPNFNDSLVTATERKNKYYMNLTQPYYCYLKSVQVTQTNEGYTS